MKNNKTNSFNWKRKKVLITGGASFIGSSLSESLLEKGANVRIVDNLSTGKKENIKSLLKNKDIEFIKADLRDLNATKKSMSKIDFVFHLAADHGGRGYLDLHQAGPAGNLYLDGLVFHEAVKAGVEKIIFASSGCVYPNSLQSDTKKEIYLTEDLVKPPFDADNLYGWAKLMGELTLKAFHKEYGVKTASCRYFTVFGPKGVENHAVIAMIARAFIKQNPFEVWGNGKQIRNWTYISDIVAGTILAAEKIDDGTAVNLGTMERTKVIDAVKETLKYTNHNADIKLLPNMPTGPLNRVADNKMAKSLLGWEPQVNFIDGLHKTIDWYYSTKDSKEVKKFFNKKLLEK